MAPSATGELSIRGLRMAKTRRANHRTGSDRGSWTPNGAVDESPAADRDPEDGRSDHATGRNGHSDVFAGNGVSTPGQNGRPGSNGTAGPDGPGGAATGGQNGRGQLAAAPRQGAPDQGRPPGAPGQNGTSPNAAGPNAAGPNAPGPNAAGQNAPGRNGTAQNGTGQNGTGQPLGQSGPAQGGRRSTHADRRRTETAGRCGETRRLARPDSVRRCGWTRSPSPRWPCPRVSRRRPGDCPSRWSPGSSGVTSTRPRTPSGPSPANSRRPPAT